MSDYKFTTDWFHWAPQVWEKLIPALPERKMFLELGAFEGRSTIWIAENMMEDGGELYAVDTWEGGEEHKRAKVNGLETENNFDNNMTYLRMKHPDRTVNKVKSTSYKALRNFNGKLFDFVYIDASHLARDVLTDACMAWPLLKKDGIMVFDDYLWGDARDILHRPKIAVDAFVNIFGEELAPMHLGYQFAVKKGKA